MGRRRYKRKSDFNELFYLAGIVWQIGAVVSGGFLFFSYMAYNLVDTLIATAEKSPFLSPIATNFGWAAYLLPLMFVVLAVLFGIKTYEAYRNEHF